MIRKLPRRLGSTRLIFIVTAASILCSVVLYVTLSILLKRFTVVGIVVAVAIPTVVAPSVSYLFVQVLHRLDLAERTLAEINAELELRVEKRAAELVKTNRELQTEIAERERMEEEARRREAQAALTYEVGRRISGELEWDELFSTVVNTVYDTFQYHSVVLMMLNEKAECLTLQSAAGNYADSIPQDVQLAIGEGMMGRVAMTGEILISGDVSQSPHYARRTEQAIKSELAVPIKSGQKVIAVLGLQSDKFDAFDEIDVLVMKTLAAQVAVAIENARLYETVKQELAERKWAEEVQRRYAERLGILHEIGYATLAALPPEAIAQAALSRVRQLISCRGAGVIMFDSEVRTATVLAIDTTVKEPVMQAGMRFSFEMFWDASEIIATLGQGKIHIIEDDLAIPQPTPAAQILQAGGIRSVLLAPLIFQEKVIGLLALVADLPNVFTSEHVDIAREAAHSLGVAIQQARLREEREVHAQRLEASLQEKEVLLKEVHHRVKNNLQIISSLLSLQSKYIMDERDFDIFRESRDRVKSMSLAHERLYQSPDLAQIDFAEYIRDLVAHSFRSYRDRSALITLRIDADDVSPGLDTAIPCGLIINELVSNALKHAFPDNRKGEIRIGLHSENGQTILTVSDDGVGFPADLDFRDTDSLGLQLVTTLVEQLEGSIELDNREGTVFKVTFTEPPYKERI
jgi:two-component sensor histidine kinase/putative methionine-R-sulfoxide reductase with GAF domain